MKKIVSIVLLLLLMVSQLIPVKALETANNVLLPERLSGTIMNETDHTIEVKSYQDENSIVLNILPSTYIVDAVTGAPVMLKDRTGDAVVVSYGPAVTMSIPPQSNAVAVICNIPQDYMPPYYAKAEAVQRNDGAVKVTTDGGSMIVTINKDTPISPYRTKNIVTIDDIRVGTELMLWYNFVAMSYPGQATATKAVVLAQENMPVSDEDNQPKYSSLDVTLEDVSLSADAEMGKITAKSEDGSVYILHTNEHTKVLDLDTMDFMKITDLEKGQSVQAFHSNHADVPTTAPPQFTPDVIVVKNENNFRSVTLDMFDKNGLSSDGELKINVSDSTPIFSADGRKLSMQDIENEDAIVFYTITTASLPPQTPPEKIIMLADKGETAEPVAPTKQQIIDSLSEEQLYIKNGVTYVMLSDVAIELGFHLSWNEDTKTVNLSKNESLIAVTIGEIGYDYADSAQEFNNPPIILNNKTFVEIDFIDALMK